MKKNRVFLMCIVMGLLLLSCESALESPEPALQPDAQAVKETVAKKAPKSAQITRLSPTPMPTQTTRPTATEIPIATPQATHTPAPAPQFVSLEWLLTADEMGPHAESVGIIDVRMVDESPGDFRVCRTFYGVSWSASENVLFHCVFSVVQGYPLDRAVGDMFASGQLYEGEAPVESTLGYEDEFILLAGMSPENGHSVYDLLRMHNGYLYWTSLTLGTPLGYSPDSLYQANRDVIDAFLDEVMVRMIEKSGQGGLDSQQD